MERMLQERSLPTPQSCPVLRWCSIATLGPRAPTPTWGWCTRPPHPCILFWTPCCSTHLRAMTPTFPIPQPSPGVPSRDGSQQSWWSLLAHSKDGRGRSHQKNSPNLWTLSPVTRHPSPDGHTPHLQLPVSARLVHAGAGPVPPTASPPTGVHRLRTAISATSPKRFLQVQVGGGEASTCEVCGVGGVGGICRCGIHHILPELRGILNILN